MMSDRLGTEPSLDLGRLHQAIQEEYTAVARDPDRGYHFHTGRPLASMLGYHDDWLEGLPEGSIASFAGTGNPFRIGQLRPGERVRSEEHTSELQSQSNLVCRLLLEKKKI